MAQLLFNNKPATPLSGTWKADFETQLGLQKYTFVFKVDGESLTASLIRLGRSGAADRVQGSGAQR